MSRHAFSQAVRRAAYGAALSNLKGPADRLRRRAYGPPLTPEPLRPPALLQRQATEPARADARRTAQPTPTTIQNRNDHQSMSLRFEGIVSSYSRAPCRRAE